MDSINRFRLTLFCNKSKGTLLSVYIAMVCVCVCVRVCIMALIRGRGCGRVGMIRREAALPTCNIIPKVTWNVKPITTEPFLATNNHEHRLLLLLPVCRIQPDNQCTGRCSCASIASFHDFANPYLQSVAPVIHGY